MKTALTLLTSFLNGLGFFKPSVKPESHNDWIRKISTDPEYLESLNLEDDVDDLFPADYLTVGMKGPKTKMVLRPNGSYEHVEV